MPPHEFTEWDRKNAELHATNGDEEFWAIIDASYTPDDLADTIRTAQQLCEYFESDGA